MPFSADPQAISNLNLDWALQYHALGYTVIPLQARHRPNECREDKDIHGEHQCPGGAADPRGSKHPRLDGWNIYQDREQHPVTEELIRHWWGENPDYGVAIVCGRASAPAGHSLVALDFDNDEGFQILLGGPDGIPGSRTPVQRTLRGYHVLIHVAGSVASTKLAELACDVQAEGKIVAVYPTIHPRTGERSYQWLRPIDSVYAIENLGQYLSTKGYEPPIGMDFGSSGARALYGDEWLNRVLTQPVLDGAGRHDLSIRLAGYLAGKHPPDVTRALVHLWNRTQVQPPIDVDDLDRSIDHCLRRELMRYGTTESGMEGLGAFIERTEPAIRSRYFHPERHLGLTTGFPRFDRVTGGFQNGKLYALGGRPGSGKTYIALEFGLRATRADKRVAIFSLEQGKDDLLDRLIQQRIGISRYELRRRGYGIDPRSEEAVLFDRALADLSPYKLFLDATPGLSISRIAEAIERLDHDVTKDPVDMVIIDYLNLIAPDEHQRSYGLYQLVTQLVVQLGDLAKRIERPVLVTVQLNREAAREEAPKPHHMRDSGAAEQRFDGIFLLEERKAERYDDDDAAPIAPGAHDRIIMHIAKQKDAPTGIKIPFELVGAGRRLQESTERM